MLSTRLGKYRGTQFLTHMVTVCLVSWRNYRTVCTIFHFHQQQMGVPIVPHPCQHLVKSVFWALSFLGSVPHCLHQAFLKLNKSF